MICDWLTENMNMFLVMIEKKHSNNAIDACIIAVPMVTELIFGGRDWLICLKTRTSIQCTCLIAPLCGYMNLHREELGCSIKMLEGSSLIGYYRALLNVITFTF